MPISADPVVTWWALVLVVVAALLLVLRGQSDGAQLQDDIKKLSSELDRQAQELAAVTSERDALKAELARKQ